MFNFLGKLAFIIIVLYGLSFTPMAQDYLTGIKEAFFEKVGNVMAEVDRISGEVDEAKEKIDDTKQKIEDAKNTITDVSDKVKGAADAIQDTLDKVGEIGDQLNGGSQEKEGDLSSEES